MGNIASPPHKKNNKYWKFSLETQIAPYYIADDIL
jgi:hypothetical protein